MNCQIEFTDDDLRTPCPNLAVAKCSSAEREYVNLMLDMPVLWPDHILAKRFHPEASDVS